MQAQKHSLARISPKGVSNTDIAVIGISCRFPGANNYQQFWQNIEQGINSITEIPSERWEVEKFYAANPQERKSISKWGGFIEDIDKFDAQFFGISSREAKRMDPQQRLMLELSWSCIEDAGYAPSQLSGGSVGVFIGVCNYDYDILQNGYQRETDGHTGTGTWTCMIPNRISYFFNFHGPSIPVDTACSSSLVALHQAINALKSEECKTALVGGVSIFCTPTRYIQMSQLGMLSPQGQCRTFDSQADGYVRGEGAGVILLKPLAQAIEDEDQIYGVIRGSAINHGGKARTLISPNVYSQAQLLCAAYTKANIAPNTISYIEAHGTGTPLGDPIEINSLKRAFRQLHRQYHLSSVDSSYCGLGTVKTNIGHLEAAAGIAGVIKVLLAMKNQKLPKIVNFQQLNPRINFDGSPFYLVCETQTWKQLKTEKGEILPRRAGISSFGVGGVNAHVILEEAPSRNSTCVGERPYHLLVLSAKNEQGLAQLRHRYWEFLTSNPEVALEDVCYTANTGREHFNHRLAVVADCREQLVERLTSFSVKTGYLGKNPPKIAFLFTGQGSQYINMGRQVYQTQPIFRQTIEQCDQILRPYLEHSLLEVLYPSQVEEKASSLLNQTAYTQPAIFAIEYALYQLWKSWGIEPDVVMGHSVGEYVAATVAGVFNLEDGLKLIAHRGQLMQQLLTGGEMVSLMASEAQVRQIIAPLHERVAIAAINGPESVVISGASEDIGTICNQLEAQGIKAKRLQVSHAFHSPLMMPMLADFVAVANQVTYKQPQISLISNVTGQKADEQIATADYWVNHVVQPVRFADSMQTLHTLGYQVFLEIGPKPILLSMGRQCCPDSEGLWLPSLRSGISEWQQLLSSLGELYVAGAKIDWLGFERDYPHEKVALPTYPFQRQRYWIQQVEQTMNEKDLAVNGNKPNLKLDATLTPSRREEILATLQALVGNLLQALPADVNIHAPFLEMGADSIILIEAVRRIENTYGIKIAIRQLFEKLTTIYTLATYIDQNLSSKWIEPDSPQRPNFNVQPHQPEQPNSAHLTPESSLHSTQDFEHKGTISPETTLERIMTQQLQVMSQQLEVLRGNGSSAKSLLSSHEQLQSTQAITPAAYSPQKEQHNQISEATPSSTPVKPELKQPSRQPFLPLSSFPNADIQGKELSLRQQYHIEVLSDRYNQRHQKSKQLAQTYRPVLADGRAITGFRPSMKEMLYPIAGERAQGSRLWDVDGNEYVDITMGFGVLLFGHAPQFINAALEKHLQQGLQIGPQSKLAGEVAQLISELTGMERVTFSNSGTEAVMTALRLARSATGRAKVALFANSYHGHFDGVLATSNNEIAAIPLDSGVSHKFVEDVLVLDYGNPKSLEILQAHAQELAAVLVEPVQSLKPDLQPKEFLHQLRQLTQASGTVLIFDEVLVGFRIHPGGAQAWFGIEADIVTYGKIIGGGTPIGVIAGKAKYMNALDGGLWNYGDASYPEAERIFFAGTFNKNHTSMVAALAVLKHLKQQGPALQQQLNQRTSQLAQTLNSYFEAEDVPIRVVHFGSQFRFVFSQNLDLFFYHLIDKGVYIWEGRRCYLSTAHTDADIDHIIQAVKDTIKELRAGGFFGAKKQLMSQADRETENSAKTPAKGFWERHRSAPSNLDLKASSHEQKPVQFSLYYFGSYDAEFSTDKYNLLFKGAKFGDRHGFTAIWIPERHFHAFGGFSPNPAVIAAALARETQQIQLRSGSVVLPLHHPIRVAEEWAVVDNLSQGRVGISFASGWHSHDFVLAPHNFGQHREMMFQEIATVQQLWQGESIEAVDGLGKKIRVKTFPMPMQSQLPIWVTVVNNPDTYIRAGEIGAGILTNLMGQSVEDLAQNIALYRESLAKNGYPPASGTVTVLLHTFVGSDLEQTRQQAKQPFFNYLKSSLGLLQNMMKSQGLQIDFDQLSPEDQDFLLSSAYERYLQTSALIGTPASCAQVVDNLRAVGVDEIACFIDFGVDEQAVLENLSHLNALKELYPQPKSISDTIPLTEAQKQLWMLAQLGDDGSVAYNESVTLQLQGPVNAKAMTKALQQIVDRHEALRTKISPQGDVQKILPTFKVDCSVIDFTGVEDAKTHAAQWLKQESQKPFDLGGGCLIRLHLLKLEPERHLLVLTAHHIVVDGWSLGVILRELGAVYSAESQGMISQLNPPKQFREFVEWQNQQNQIQKSKTHQSYWWQKLAAPPILDLPSDRNRPAIKTYHASRESIKLDAQVTKNLKLFSQQQGCTLLMTLLSVYTTLIHRLTGQDDIIVGVPTSGRYLRWAAPTLLGSEAMVGYCAHFLPIRSQLSGHPTFAEYLQQMRDNLFEAYEHQDYPFAQLLNQLDLPRDNSRSPLIDVSFNLEPPISLPQMPQLEISLFRQTVSFKDRDLHLNVLEIAGELVVECDYNTTLFDADTIGRWLSHFQTLLQAVVSEPKQHLRSLPLLTAAQRHQLLVEWNDTQADYPEDKCINQLFEQQVQRHPDAVALVFGNQQITYHQLNCRANQLANYLKSLGVGADVLVGLCVERSIEMIVGLLGILKAGGAYVPLDPEYPQERLSLMLEDAQVSVLLTQKSLLGRLPQHNAKLVCLDADVHLIAQCSQDNLITDVQPSNLAYVMYTSGSTGQPKGVEVVHRGINRLLFGVNYAHFDATQVFLQLAPISFDASTLEIWGALLHGAKCVLFPGTIPTSQTLGDEIKKHGVTILWLTAALFNSIIDDDEKALSGIKQLLIGGEALSVAHVHRALQALPATQIINGYGPTESTTFTCCHPISREIESTTESIPLGRPIGNTQVYILDKYLQPVPVGVPGELHIGGAGLARGYSNRGELTKEKFIPHPLSDEPHSRLYKTGDLVRYLIDGNIQYLGRIDNQVKLRGFRIELGEIEAVLSQHDDVQVCCAIAHENNPGDKSLVAYVVPQQTANISKLRQFLKAKLPEYMIPNAFVILESLPLTANGKIDRRALPLPDLELSRSVSYIAPRNSTEQAIADIFTQVLQVEKVGINDNFFEMGGNSLKATQVISRLRETFSLEFPQRRLLKQPTVAELALSVEEICSTMQKLQESVSDSLDNREEIDL
jgi:iturin family lipopeptide synthetase A